MFSELEKIFNQLTRFLFRKYAIDQASTILKKIKKDWVTNKKNYLLSQWWHCYKISFTAS